MNIFNKFLLFVVVCFVLNTGVEATTYQLNDTGINFCININKNVISTACKKSRQDASYGRDTEVKNNLDGRLGFSFRKICHSGELAGTGSCPINPFLGKSKNNWGCTLDNVTGLIWEIKTNAGLRSNRNLYTNTGDRVGTDANGFVNLVNKKIKLCNASNWRLPTVTELHSIINYGNAKQLVDIKWFPRTIKYSFWSADSYAIDGAYAWFMDFESGYADYYYKYSYRAVILVRENV